jgi:hypothetical protein
VLGEAARLVLRINQPAVDDHVELPSASYFELSDCPGRFLDRGRETRSLGFVVSHLAVFDLDLHGALLCELPVLRSIARIGIVASLPPWDAAG